MKAYAERLISEGHCYQSGARNIRVAADYSVWLARKRYKVTDVNEASILKYEQFRQKHRHPFLSDHAALIRLIKVLRALNATAEATIILDPLSQIIHEFEQHLMQNHGLCETSVIRHRITEIESIHVLKVQPFDQMGKPMEIAKQAFGNRKGYDQAITELETELYSNKVG
jgi:hypothetical protein